MFSITDRVVNSGSAPVQLFPYGLVARSGTPKTEGFYILHEGPLAVMDGTLREPSYSDLKDKKKIEYDTTGGWLGITDKYWLVTLVPDQKVPVKARFNHSTANGEDRYQADFPRAGDDGGSGRFGGDDEPGLRRRQGASPPQPLSGRARHHAVRPAPSISAGSTGSPSRSS